MHYLNYSFEMCLCEIQIVLAFVFANFGNPDRMPNRRSKKSWDLVGGRRNFLFYHCQS